MTLLLTIIALSFANVIRPQNECAECVYGVPHVPVDVIVTPPPVDIECAEGIIDVSRPLPPVTPAPPPPC